MKTKIRKNMDVKLYEKIQESLEDVFQPPTEEEMGEREISLRQAFIERIKEQGAYENEDGTWSSDKSIYVENKGIDHIPIQFKEVKGDFACCYNNLTTLKGCPGYVGGDFSCSGNLLTSLEGGPKKVGGYFSCAENNITSLEGGPEIVGWSYNCMHNKLTTLKGYPKVLGGTIKCGGNPVSEKELLAMIGGQYEYEVI